MTVEAKSSALPPGAEQRGQHRLALSLFTGAMGLDLGLERSGFRICVCVDNDGAACAAVRHNRPDIPVIEDDIRSVSAEYLLETAGLAGGEIDAIVGGPPCQAFSTYGRRRGVGEARGAASYEFVRLIEEVRPKIFIMENVRGLLSLRTSPQAHKGSLYEEIVRKFEGAGYRVDCFVVNAANYGAPQIRERIIVIGNRYGQEAEFPARTHSNRPRDGLAPFTTLGDAILGKPDPDPTLMDFSERKKRYLAMVPPGGNWRHLPLDIQKESMGKTWYLKGGRSAYWRKLSFEFPCPTIVTMPNHAGTSLCHPVELRPLTVGECALVQGFPEDWRFIGSPQEKYAQVGNAVPVVLGEVAGQAGMRLLDKIDTEGMVSSPHPCRVVHIRPHVRTRWWYRRGHATDPIPYVGGEQKAQQLKLTLEAG